MTHSLHATSSDTFGDHIVILPNIWKNKTKQKKTISYHLPMKAVQSALVQ